MPERERRLYKFVVRPGDDADVRKTLGPLPQSLGEGDDAVGVTALIRGSGVFLLLESAGDPFEALGRDARGKKILDALREHADYSPDSVAENEIPRFPRRPATAEQEASAR